MEFEVIPCSDATQISIRGEVDLFYSPKLREVIINELKDGNNIIVELSEVSYIDSSGIASLVESFQYAKSHGLDFTLLNVSTPVLQVLKLARLDQVLPNQ